MSFGIPVRNGLGAGLLPSTTLATLRLGGRPALLLNFISTTALPSTITFSRGTQATLTDATGKITYAPNNLLTNSQQFDNVASWTLEGSTLSGGRTAPDGTATAYLFTATAPSGNRRITQVVTQVTGVNYIRSIWLRRVTGTGTILLRNPTGGDTDITSQISSTWSRIFVTGTATGASNFILTFTVTGDALEIWGAAMEAVTYQTTPSTYVSTTPKNLLGFTQEFDNAAWTKSNAFVQTNLLTYSSQIGATNWLNTGAATNAQNNAVAPDGTTTAMRLNATAATSNFGYYQSVTYSAIAYTLSVFAKAGTYSRIAVDLMNVGTSAAAFDLSAGTVIATSAGFTSTITSVGDGWFRLTVTGTMAAGAGFPEFYLNGSASAIQRNFTAAGTETVFLWGAQLVQGATAGNYQPTYAAAAAVQYAAPDGTLSADKLVETTAASASHQIYQTLSTVTSGTSYTYSVYLKAAERGFALVEATAGAMDVYAYVNLNTGATGTTSGAVSVVNAGSGWWRVSVTGTTASTTLLARVFTATDISTVTYTGDGTSGIYVWGAQLSNSASLDPYSYNPGAAPTSTAYYGPRFDYDPVTLDPKGLLIEEARTNLLTYSAQFDDASWTKNNVTIAANTTASPDGTVTADTVTSTGTVTPTVYKNLATTATAHTFSVYLKQGNTAFSEIEIIDQGTVANRVRLTYATGALTVVSGSPTGTVTNAGNGWWRVTIAYTFPATGTADTFAIYPSTTTGVVGEFAYVYGAQLEAGAFATSYIPTVASTVTRSADVATMLGTNFSSWYNQNAGTFTAGFDTVGVGAAFNIWVLAATDATPSGRIIMGGNPGSGRGFVFASGATQADMLSGTITNNVAVRGAIAYATNDFAFTLNGASPTLDTVGTLPTPDRLSVGQYNGTYVNGHIRSLAYYNSRLPNGSLQALTT